MPDPPYLPTCLPASLPTWTALLAAVETGNEEVVHAPIEGDADVDAAPWDGWTPLMRADGVQNPVEPPRTPATNHR